MLLSCTLEKELQRYIPLRFSSFTLLEDGVVDFAIPL